MRVGFSTSLSHIRYLPPRRRKGRSLHELYRLAAGCFDFPDLAFFKLIEDTICSLIGLFLCQDTALFIGQPDPVSDLKGSAGGPCRSGGQKAVVVQAAVRRFSPCGGIFPGVLRSPLPAKDAISSFFPA